MKTTMGRNDGCANLIFTRNNGWKKLHYSTGCGAMAATVMNRISWNGALGMWGRYCLGAASYKCGLEWSVKGECSMGLGTFYSTVPGVGRTKQLKGSNRGSGGPMNMVPIGRDGWLASGLYPFGGSKIFGLINLPGPQQKFRRNWLHRWMFLDLEGGRDHVDIGFINLSRVGRVAQDRFLLGYATHVTEKGTIGEAGQYYVQEVTKSGCLLGQPLKVDGAGWGEDNVWTYMPNSGCVVFPFTWEDRSRAGRPYMDARASSILRVTSYCPAQSAPAHHCKRDVNQCAGRHHGCSVHADCENLVDRPGGETHLCYCKPGFQGNGKSCVEEKTSQDEGMNPGGPKAPSSTGGAGAPSQEGKDAPARPPPADAPEDGGHAPHDGGPSSTDEPGPRKKAVPPRGGFKCPTKPPPKNWGDSNWPHIYASAFQNPLVKALIENASCKEIFDENIWPLDATPGCRVFRCFIGEVVVVVFLVLVSL